MIPAGVEPVNAEGVARIRDMSLGGLRNSGILKSPSFPPALNAHRARDLVWDPADVTAHRDGLPPRPRATATFDDFLDESETAAVVGLSLETFTDEAERLGLRAWHVEAHALRYYRRGDLPQRYAKPPGKPGKPRGAKDLTPRKKRGAPTPVAVNAAQQIEALAAHLKQLAEAGAAQPTATELAERYDVSTRTIQRWLARITEPT
jgi:hypothetical protein